MSLCWLGPNDRKGKTIYCNLVPYFATLMKRMTKLINYSDIRGQLHIAGQLPNSLRIGRNQLLLATFIFHSYRWSIKNLKRDKHQTTKCISKVPQKRILLISVFLLKRVTGPRWFQCRFVLLLPGDDLLLILFTSNFCPLSTVWKSPFQARRKPESLFVARVDGRMLHGTGENRHLWPWSSGLQWISYGRIC